jgi:hypothetical protein
MLLCFLSLFIGILLPHAAQASKIVINGQPYGSYYDNPSPPVQSSELLVISVYDTNTDHSGGTRWEGIANVNIMNGGPVPATLVLSSYEPALWQLTVEPGVQIVRIILNGYNKQRVTVADSSGNAITNIPVIDRSGDGNYFSACAYVWPSSTGGCDTPGLISGVEAYTGLKLTAFAGAYQAADFSVVVGSNALPSLPVAVAGEDRSVDAESDGFAHITLDGSGSYSQNNQELTYFWSWPLSSQAQSNVIYQAQGKYPTIQLPVGINTVQLIVNDGTHNSIPAYVKISVNPPQPPEPPQGDGIKYTATVTADNYYAIYTGTPENLRYVGKYGDQQFQTAETITFTAKPGEYIYVAAWNAGGPKAWLGQFVSDAGTILSGTTDWEYYLTNNPYAIIGNNPPMVNAVMDDLAKAAWSQVQYSIDNTPYTIWTMMNGGVLIGGISPNAKWIWGSSMDDWSNYGEYQLFRARVPLLPIADAGSNQTVRPGSTVVLNASGSSDPSGKYPLSYSWSFVPAGPDNPALSDSSSINPTFVAGKIGDYNLRLVVTNSLGVKSDPAYVLVSTYNTAPVAEAGPDKALTVKGTRVQLDASQSYDQDGDSISYSWFIDTAPDGSAAAIANAGSVNPTFTPDVYGKYILKLRVADEWGAVGEDTVKLSFENLAPVSSARYNQSLILGESAEFDGSQSTDPNGDALTYLWNTVSAPQGSSELLVNVSAPAGSFTPDVPGTYILGLVVSDGVLSSTSSNITIEVLTRGTAATRAVREAIDYINGLNPSAFKNGNMADTLTKELNVAIGMLDKGNYTPAVNKLSSILKKTDGTPEPADFIIDHTAQTEVYALILNAITLLNQ